MDTSRLPTYLRQNNAVNTIAASVAKTSPKQVNNKPKRSFKTEFDTNFKPISALNGKNSKTLLSEQQNRLNQLYQCKKDQKLKLQKLNEIRQKHSDLLDSDDFAKLQYVYNDIKNILSVADNEIAEIQQSITEHKTKQLRLYEQLCSDLASVDKKLVQHFQIKLSNV